MRFRIQRAGLAIGRSNRPEPEPLPAHARTATSTFLRRFARLAVPASSPIKSVQDLVDAAKVALGKLCWAHTGKGGTYNVSG
ncbi:tripartite tricarboxylate transporter substrate-binding protein [Falsiruegeria litorea]|uniref:Uncharacterized protein n=1 Tax=Falsiruegeria litorea TaxID=1280831 RepID=A0ABS5WW88_9RHOB|nr:tripartite tricarboxylate transporter substrate-binding protein [Falsiruegeria litorea]MBT3143318.1 hypothetical protein [Falsiruegeria litorea]MBT8167582.1 hypothetical protein [Falsiruegeria litorea]